MPLSEILNPSTGSDPSADLESLTLILFHNATLSRVTVSRKTIIYCNGTEVAAMVSLLLAASLASVRSGTWRKTPSGDLRGPAGSHGTFLDT